MRAEAVIAELRALESLRPVLDAVTALSGPYEGVYLVGGTVRDLLLGERSFDVDIAVEGDAIALAEALAEALGGRVRAHPKFGTAAVFYGEQGRVDVVTARTESYHAPAVLPSVEHDATIQEDLFRRDFTINAMAVSLRPDDLGRLVDPFGGRADLEARRLRVLHPRSFIDDPTRIFRAVRYENRLGFRMGDETLQLAHDSVETGHVGDLSPARLRDELVALFGEGEVEHTIVRIAELGLDEAIHPHLAADAETIELLGRLTALDAEYELGVPAWRLGFAVLLRRLPAEEVLGWLRRLKLRRRDAELITAAVSFGPRIAESLSAGAPDPSEVVALADPYAPDAPLFALALADLEPLRDYFRRLRGVRLEVTGTDLAGLGVAESPRVGEILAELRRRKLNGELEGRDAELAAARELIGS
jgi:tRNA nucleotidyltransferase (CCA-adding enzyme)